MQEEPSELNGIQGNGVGDEGHRPAQRGGRRRQGALEVCLHPMKEAEEPSQRQLELGVGK